MRIRSIILGLSLTLSGSAIAIIAMALLAPGRPKVSDQLQRDARSAPEQSNRAFARSKQGPTANRMPAPEPWPNVARSDEQESPMQQEDGISPVASPLPSITENASPPSPTTGDTLENMRRHQQADRTLIAELHGIISQFRAQLQERPSLDAQPASAATQQARIILTLGDGFFQSGQFVPATSLQDTIERILPVIEESPMDIVAIEGHTDSSTSDSAAPDRARRWNMTLSRLRAQAVANVLEQNGIPRARIIVEGYGDSVPLASNSTETGRAKNRRVDIKLIPHQR